MTSGVGDNGQPLSHQSKQRATSGAEKYPSRVHPTSYKGQLPIACSSNNIPVVHTMERVKEVIRMKNKEKSRQQR